MPVEEWAQSSVKVFPEQNLWLAGAHSNMLRKCAPRFLWCQALHHNHFCLTVLEIYEIVINYTMNKHCNQDKRKLLSDRSRIFLIFFYAHLLVKYTYIHTFLGPPKNFRETQIFKPNTCSLLSRLMLCANSLALSLCVFFLFCSVSIV